MAEEMNISKKTPVPIRHDIYKFIETKNFQGSLSGKVVLVTGAGRGIGFELAKAFASAGASVACVSRTSSELTRLVSLLQENYNVKAIGISADVSEDGVPQSVIRRILEELGPVDVLVNNAGIYRLNPLEHERDFNDWWRVLEVNLRGPVAFAHAVLPHMIERHAGVIISIGSRSAARTAPFSTAYSTSKAALLRFHQNLDCEVRDQGINTFYVQPGDVPTSISHGPRVINLEAASKIPALQQVLERSIGASTESPRLVANTILWLCTNPEAHLLAGKYVNAEQDLETIIAEARKGPLGEIARRNLYSLKLEELS